MADHLAKMVKNSADYALARASKNSKKVERISAEVAAAKCIQLEAKIASKEGLEKAERDQRQKSYREKGGKGESG